MTIKAGEPAPDFTLPGTGGRDYSLSAERGHVAITDLVDYGLELPVDSDAYNSVGGFVFGELGRLPKRGDTIHHNGYSIRVESVRENRIEAVRIRERRATTA